MTLLEVVSVGAILQNHFVFLILLRHLCHGEILSFSLNTNEGVFYVQSIDPCLILTSPTKGSILNKTAVSCVENAL